MNRLLERLHLRERDIDDKNESGDGSARCSPRKVIAKRCVAKHTQSIQFNDLPDDVLELIFIRCTSAAEKLRVSRVCTRFRRIALRRRVWHRVNMIRVAEQNAHNVTIQCFGDEQRRRLTPKLMYLALKNMFAMAPVTRLVWIRPGLKEHWGKYTQQITDLLVTHIRRLHSLQVKPFWNNLRHVSPIIRALELLAATEVNVDNMLQLRNFTIIPWSPHTNSVVNDSKLVRVCVLLKHCRSTLNTLIIDARDETNNSIASQTVVRMDDDGFRAYIANNRNTLNIIKLVAHEWLTPGRGVIGCLQVCHDDTDTVHESVLHTLHLLGFVNTSGETILSAIPVGVRKSLRDICINADMGPDMNACARFIAQHIPSVTFIGLMARRKHVHIEPEQVGELVCAYLTSVVTAINTPHNVTVKLYHMCCAVHGVTYSESRDVTPLSLYRLTFWTRVRQFVRQRGLGIDSFPASDENTESSSTFHRYLHSVRFEVEDDHIDSYKAHHDAATGRAYESDVMS